MSRPDHFVPSNPELSINEDFVSEFEAAHLEMAKHGSFVLATTFDPDLFALRVRRESIHHLYEE